MEDCVRSCVPKHRLMQGYIPSEATLEVENFDEEASSAHQVQDVGFLSFN